MPVCAPPIATDPAGTAVRGDCAPRRRELRRQAAKIGKAGSKSETTHVIAGGGMTRDHFVRRKPAMLRDRFEIERKICVVADRQLDQAGLVTVLRRRVAFFAGRCGSPRCRLRVFRGDSKNTATLAKAGAISLTPGRFAASSLRVVASTSPNESSTRTISAESPSVTISMGTAESAVEHGFCKALSQCVRGPHVDRCPAATHVEACSSS